MSQKSKAKQQKIQVAVSGCTSSLARILRRAAQRTLQLEKKTGIIDIRVLGGTAMAKEHRTWLGQRGPTDVMTFDLRDAAHSKTIEGQLLVCRDVARTVARQMGHDWMRELALYVVHGCLHLCGYDDQSPADFLRIHRREKEIFSSLGWISISP
jgi:probable rRNA maturation factor